MDVENLDALNPAQLDELLERALNPQVPVEVLYAVLDRIGSAPDAPTPAGSPVAGSAAADVEQTAVLPPLATLQHPRSPSVSQAQLFPEPARGAATDRAVRPERPKNRKQAADQQMTAVLPSVQIAKSGQHPLPTASALLPKVGQLPTPTVGAQAPTQQPMSQQQKASQQSETNQQAGTSGHQQSSASAQCQVSQESARPSQHQQPRPASAASHPARGAHAPSRRQSSSPGEAGA